MYRDRGRSKPEIDRKKINDALDKHLEKLAPSAALMGLNGKDNDRLIVASGLPGRLLPDHKDALTAALSSNIANQQSDVSVLSRR